MQLALVDGVVKAGVALGELLFGEWACRREAPQQHGAGVDARDGQRRVGGQGPCRHTSSTRVAIATPAAIAAGSAGAGSASASGAAVTATAGGGVTNAAGCTAAAETDPNPRSQSTLAQRRCR